MCYALIWTFSKAGNNLQDIASPSSSKDFASGLSHLTYACCQKGIQASYA